MRVASRVLRFTIPVLVVAGLGADVVVIGVVVRGIGVVSMVMGINVLAVIGVVVRGIGVLVVGNVVVVSDGEVGYIVPFAGAVFFREISPLVFVCAR